MLKNILCLIVATCFLLIVSIYSSPKFSKYSGDITLYAYGYSSNCVSIKGRAIHSGESFNASKEKINVKEFLSEYSAEILFMEETEEGINYYAYTEKLTTEKIIRGKKINLHIFIGESEVTIGTPIIYGSF